MMRYKKGSLYNYPFSKKLSLYHQKRKLMVVKTNYSVKDITTFGIDAKAALYAEASSTQEIVELLSKYPQTPIYILGGGSNIVFTKDFEGLLLHPNEQTIEKESEDSDSVTIKCSAGVDWDSFVQYTVEQGWGGLENLSLIPGNVGASPVQNIGAYGVEVKDTITKVEGLFIDGCQPFCFRNEECHFGYRESIFKHDLKGKCIITHVYFRLSKRPILKTHYGNIEEELKSYATISIASIRKAVIAIRERKLPSPKVFGNCGSFFKNPTIPVAAFEQIKQSFQQAPSYPVTDDLVKVPAAWLIETCGFKGIKRGNVGVHSQQALVLINLGGATGAEVISLAKEIIDSVEHKFGITLEMEANIL